MLVNLHIINLLNDITADLTSNGLCSYSFCVCGCLTLLYLYQTFLKCSDNFLWCWNSTLVQMTSDTFYRIDFFLLFRKKFEGKCQTNHNNQLVSDHIILVYTFYHLISYQFPVRSTSLVNIIKPIHRNNWWAGIPPWWLHINNYQRLHHLYLNCIQHFCSNNWSSSNNNYNSYSNIFWVCFRWQNWSMHKQSSSCNNQRAGWKVVKLKMLCQHHFI